VGSPKKIDLESLHPETGEYHPNRELRYISGYPIIEGYRNTVALGWSFRWRDPMMFKSVKADISYSLGTDNGEISNSERLHVDVEYKTLFWRFRYWHNDADFYDLFGPTERARKGDAFIARYRKPIMWILMSHTTPASIHYRGIRTSKSSSRICFQSGAH
jgi:hypothetical protein